MSWGVCPSEELTGARRILQAKKGQYTELWLVMIVAVAPRAYESGVRKVGPQLPSALFSA